MKNKLFILLLSMLAISSTYANARYGEGYSSDGKSCWYFETDSRKMRNQLLNDPDACSDMTEGTWRIVDVEYGKAREYTGEARCSVTSEGEGDPEDVAGENCWCKSDEDSSWWFEVDYERPGNCVKMCMTLCLDTYSSRIVAEDLVD